MNYANKSIATAIVGIIALLPGSTVVSAQATVDLENRYPSVGAIMIWRVDDSGKPVELRGFASGTLIRDRVMVTAGHLTAPAKALGELPPSIRIFASFSPTNAKARETWIPVIRLATHPSMPHCPPPPQCDPTDDILVAPLQPGIADVGLIFLEHAPKGIKPAHFAEDHGTLERSEGTQTTIVGYGTLTPRKRGTPPDTSIWDGKRRIRTSKLRRVVDETWALWSIPSYVCSGDSGGAIFPKAMQAQFDTLAVTAREDITEEVIPAGEYAVEIGHYTSQGTSKANKTPRSSAGRYMALWRKDSDGVWRLHRDIGTDAPPKKP